MSGLLPRIDRSKTVKSRDYRGSSSFATFMIVAPVCFFLGVIFAQFPYDYPLLWTSDPVAPSFFDQHEIHLKWMHQSPPLIARLLHIIMAVGFLGFFIKLFKPSESNMLFDGASLVLYVIGLGVYVANIVKGLRTISSDVWQSGVYEEKHDGPLTGEVILGRDDSLKVMSASNTILALVLVGILVLQAGQFYAEKKELDEYELLEKSDEQQKSAAKKKQ
ncbi:Secretory component protein SHR3 [Cytospora mali]|uniref:Secretory component protein SHR3 n=2 Tax=Cytospora mali TaxID=578113 RepID=A0ACD6AYL5_CYTMA|nr:Secretory component protein SHR3 [Valsa mali var. pyri (nom. inval.)]KUI66202.1 Secretory component protein SHR3 [Valsa mali]